MPDGVEVGCRKCWQCRENYINDWVGRVIAESQVAAASHMITLTYGPDENGDEDHVRARILTYSDVQKYFRKLRKAGYPLRYFVVGEYGSQKGRAHWHLLAFWQDKVPPHELDKRFNEPHWADEKERVRGYSQWERMSYSAARYMCKYITKDVLDRGERQGHLAMSKKPPLGDGFFRQLAKDYVQQGLAPQDAFYGFPDVCDKRGKRIKFYLRGTSRENFVRYYENEYKQRHRYAERPNSVFVDEINDAIAARAASLVLRCTLPRNTRPMTDDLPEITDGGWWSEPHAMWVSRVNGVMFVWLNDDEQGTEWSWRKVENLSDVLKLREAWYVDQQTPFRKDEWYRRGRYSGPSSQGA